MTEELDWFSKDNNESDTVVVSNTILAAEIFKQKEHNTRRSDDGTDYEYGIFDAVLKDRNSFAGNMAEGLGAAMTLYSLNKSAKIMQNPEIIAKMVECANTTTGAEVRQILKVYNYIQNSHRVKIRCDYRIMRTGQIKYNKNSKKS